MAMDERQRRARYDRIKLPVVNPQAIVDYLGRPLQSWDFLKDAPKEELYDHAYGMGMRFTSDPWLHQLVCFTIGTQLPSFLFFLKMGGGKSRIGLDLIRYRKRQGELNRAIIIVPELLHVASWEEQIKEHAPDLKYRLLLGDRQDRLAMLDQKADIFVINFAGLMTYMTEMVFDQKKKRNARKLFPTLASEFAARFNFVLFDEIHRIVDMSSVYYEMFLWISASCDFRYGLSGTSHGRDPAPLFSQFRLIDGGETFGESFGMFQRAFYTPKKDWFAAIKWEFNDRMIPYLHKMVKHRSISYEVTEFQDMPLKMYVRIPVTLRGEGLDYYERIMKKMAQLKGDYRSLDNVYVRLRQCASGFLSLKADDSSRIEVQFKVNPKLESLHAFLLSKPDEKILVFHEYTHSGRLIEQMLTAAKIPYASARGEIKDVAAEYHRFLEDKKCRIFVVNNRVGSEAINPQYVCRRAIFYESPDDPKRRDQAEMRVWRPGQKWTVFIHDLLVKNTIEEKIQRYNKEGKNLLKAVMTGKDSLE